MRKIGIVCSVAVLVWASQASAGYVFFENFESGVSGWTLHQQTGTGTGTMSQSAEGTGTPVPLGNISPESGANASVARIGAPSTTWFNSMMYKTINVPTGVTLNMDGFWRTNGYKRNSQWSEVIIYDGQFTPPSGQDVNPGMNGSLAGGETMYKVYSNNDPNSVGWYGQLSNTTIFSTQQYTKSTLATTGFQSTTGQLTIILKYGISCAAATSGKNMEFDDIFVTPEPAAMALLVLGVPLLMRRRRA